MQFALVFNSQSSRSSALGPKWTHSYRFWITGTSPAIVIADDGTETSYTLSGGNYTPPVGIYDSLVKNQDSTWTLTRKGGTLYHFNSSGLLTSIVDLNGNSISLTYSGSVITVITDAANRALQLGYTGSQLTSVTDCQNRVWSLAFDGSSRVKQVSDPLLNGQTYSRQMAYDSSNNVNALTNRLGKTWQYACGTNNVFASTTDPNTKTASHAYVFHTQPQVPVGDPPLSWPSGTAHGSTWTDANGGSTQLGYDSSGNVLSIVDANYLQTNFTVDSSHNRLTQQLPSGATFTYTWDSRANKLTSTDPLSHQTVMTYDTGDRLLTTKDALGPTVTNQYDSNGNLVSVTDSLNETTGYTLNSDGTLASVTDAMNRTTQFGYDAWGHRTSITDPLNHVTAFVFDAGSHLTQRTDALNRMTNYSLDAWGRLTGWSYPTSGNPSVSLSLDAEGNVTQAVDGTGTWSYSYDVWNRPLQLSDPRGTTTATYDNVGNLLTQTDVTGRQLSYQYNAGNQLTQVGDGSGNAVYTYTADGYVATIAYPNGTQVSYGTDSAGRITSLSHTNNGTTLISYAAQYDHADRLTQLTEQPSGDVTTFGYDDANRLSSESRTGTYPYAGTYGYDSSGLRTSAVVITNGTTVHNGSYSYDTAGRLDQVVDSATQITEVYTWNDDGTLASYPYQGNTITAAYNEESLLVSLSVNGVTAYQYGYAWDNARRWKQDMANNLWTWYPCGVACKAGDLVEEQSDLSGQSWTASALYLRGVGCGSGIIRRNSEYHHADPTGTIAVITNASGAIQNSNLYDRFGVLRFDITGSAQTQWRWVGAFAGEEGMIVLSSGQREYVEARAFSITGSASMPPTSLAFSGCTSTSPYSCLDPVTSIPENALHTGTVLPGACTAAQHAACVAFCTKKGAKLRFCIAGPAGFMCIGFIGLIPVLC